MALFNFSLFQVLFWPDFILKTGDWLDVGVEPSYIWWLFHEEDTGGRDSFIREEVIDFVLEMYFGTSLTVWWLRLRLSMQGVQVRALVGELRSHTPPGVAKKINKLYISFFF